MMHLHPSSKMIALIALIFGFFALPISGSLRAETVPAPTDTSASGELVFWNSIKKSESAADFDVYLKTFPDGMFAEIAKSRYQELGGTVAVSAPKVEEPPVTEPKVKEVMADEPVAKKVISKPKPKKRVSSVFVKKKKSKWVSTKSKRKYAKKSKQPVFVKVKYSKPKPKVVKKKVFFPVNEPASGSSGGGGGGGSGGGGGGWSNSGG